MRTNKQKHALRRVFLLNVMEKFYITSRAFLAATRSCLSKVRKVDVAMVMRTYFPVFLSKTFLVIKLGKKRLRVARLEKERKFPDPGAFPLISHRRAIH
jgi:hypothetical protein